MKRVSLKTTRPPMVSHPQPPLRALLWQRWTATVPGLLLTSGLALGATLVQTTWELSLLSPLLLSILLGILLRNTVGLAPVFYPGVRFSLKTILKLAIILLGLRLSLGDIATLGLTGFVMTSILLVSTVTFTLWLGSRLGISQKLVYLIAAGTSICGASAVVTANSVVDSSEEEMAYAIGLITALGTVAMLLYPLVPELLHLSSLSYGIWCGASIHEVAQVVAASFQHDLVSGEFATLSKLSRVLYLAPLTVVLSMLTQHGKPQGARMYVPWFVVMFLGVVGINSLGIIPIALKSGILHLNKLLLGISLAGMGL
ncbi:MAG: putative sulfate exporter family transporter, partial [Thermostichales cyanobacterium DRC_bins_46]